MAKKKVKRAKRAKGRPTIFNDKMRARIQALARKGFTEEDMCFALGIDNSTLTKWKQRKPEFFTSLNDWKSQADEEVVRCLFERAKGYSHPETKAQWINGSEGEPGRWETLDMTRHYPPDPTSMIYWTKNRMPKDWRDKVDAELSGKVDHTLTIIDYSTIGKVADDPK